MTKDEIIKIAQKVTGVSFPLGIEGISIGMNEKHLQDFAKLVAAAEREACAKLFESYEIFGEDYDSYYADKYAALIRARGQE